MKVQFSKPRGRQLDRAFRIGFSFQGGCAFLDIICKNGVFKLSCPVSAPALRPEISLVPTLRNRMEISITLCGLPPTVSTLLPKPMDQAKSSRSGPRLTVVT
jgi:hypothetical protein